MFVQARDRICREELFAVDLSMIGDHQAQFGEIACGDRQTGAGINLAGRIDGLGYCGTFVRIVLPNSVGVTVALGSINFINSWNAFLWPLVVGQDQSTWTVQVTVSSFLNAYHIDLPALFAASLLAVLPLVLLFFVFQRYIVQGVKLSGVKG